MGKDLGAVFFPALSGTLMSSILLVPSLFGFLASSRGTVKVPLSSLLLYGGNYYKQLFTQFLTVTPSEDASAVWYFSMGALVFIAVMVTFMGNRTKKKWWIAGLGLTVLAVCSPLVGYVMNGMGYITNRFMFIASFFMACLVVKMLPEIYRLNSTQKKRLLAGAGVYGITAGIVAGKESVVQSVCMIVFLIITCALLWFVKEEKKLRLAVFVVLICNIAVNGNVMYQPFGANIQKTYLKAGTVQKQYDQKAVREAAKASDTTKMEQLAKEQKELVSNLQTQISEKEKSIELIENNIKELEEKIQAKQAEIDAWNAQIENRMKNEQTTIGTNMIIDLIMGSDSLSDMLRRIFWS